MKPVNVALYLLRIFTVFYTRSCRLLCTHIFTHRSIKSLPTSSGEEDEDVVRERERVQKGGAQNDLLRICDLTKVFPVPVFKSNF